MKNVVLHLITKITLFFRYHGIPLGIVLVLAVIICRNILFSSGLPEGGDMLGWIGRVQFFSKAAMTGGTIFPIWSPESFGGLTFFSLDWLLAILNLAFRNSNLLIRGFIFLSFLLSGIFMYWFVYRYTHRRLPSLAAALMYIMNQYYVMIVTTTGHLNVFAAYALYPLILVALDNALIKSKLRSIIAFSFLVFVLFILNRVDQLLYFMPVLIIFTLFAVISPHNGMSRKTTSLHLAKIIFIGGAFVAFLAAFQLLPSIFGAMSEGLTWGGRGATVEMHQNNSLPFYENLILWRSLETHFAAGKSLSFPYLGSTLLYLLSAVPVMLVFSAILFRRDRMILALTVSVLILLFLAKGPHAPLGQAYWWLVHNFPFFSSLRAPNRWLQPGVLCYAFLGGFALDQIYNRLLGSWSSHNKAKSRRFLRKVYAKLPHICVLLLMLPLLFISWYPIANGLPVWQPPKQEVEPHLWLAQQTGDFMVVTVPYAEGWMRLQPELGSDLMTTTDLGLVSSYYHNRRVMGTGGNQFYSKLFTRYTAGLLYFGEIEELSKILGTFNTKYIVLQGYPPQWKEKPYQDNPNWQHDYFEEQQGLTLVYDNGTAHVYENEFWTPLFFAPSKAAVMVGGRRDTLHTFKDIENFNLNKWGLLFSNQISNELSRDRLLDTINQSKTVIFAQNCDLFDLSMITLDDGIKIRAVDYAYPSSNTKEHWISSEWAVTKMGMFVLNDRTLSTYGDNSISIPINVESDGEYELWVRLVVGLNRGWLTLSLDGREIGSINPKAEQYSDLQWFKIGTVELGGGSHELELQNTVLTTRLGMGNDVDEIVLVKSGSLQIAMDKLYRVFQDSPTQIISSLSPQRIARVAEFGEKIICNDNQISFWHNANPASVVLSNDSEVKAEDSQNSLKIDIREPGRKFFNLLSKSYDTMQDWSHVENIALWFKGNNTGERFNLIVYFNNSPDDYVTFTIPDASTEWKQFFFAIGYPTSSKGTVDWRNVSTLKLSGSHKDSTGSFHIDRVRRVNARSELIYDAPKAGDYGLAIMLETGPSFGTLNITMGDMESWVNLDTYRKMGTTIVANANQTDFWVNANPGQVNLVDDANIKVGTDSRSSLKMILNPGRKFYTLIQKSYTSPQDWSQDEYLSLWFKGEGSGAYFNISAYSNPVDPNTDYAAFRWIDDSTEWRQLVFPLANPFLTEGSIDWNNVYTLKLGNNDKNVTGAFYLDRILPYRAIYQEPELKWFNIESPLTLIAGENVLSLQTQGRVNVRQIVLYSLDETESNVHIEDLFAVTGDENPKISYKEINSTKYVVHVKKATEPFWLIFSDSYHPLWRAYVDNEEIDSVPAYSFVNGFYLTKTGEYDVVIEFTGQRYVHWGGIISLSSLFLAFSLITLEWKWPLWRRRKKED